jgi:selenocysteine-specific elongation factor
MEVSSLTGEGIDALIQILDQMVSELPERDEGHFFRLPIDRVFTMRGFGTVITGTTISGKINTGDEVTIYPSTISTRIRGIQVHNREVNEVRAGLRTAINLQGIEKMQIGRGDVVAAKDSLKPTYMVDVILEILPSAPKKLKNRAKARFHTGTSEIIATIILLDRDELLPGDACFAQIRLDEATAVLHKDRYVLRSYSPVRAIGGGEVLHALPLKKKRFSEKVLKELKLLHDGSLEEIAGQFVAMGRFQGIGRKDLRFLTNSGHKTLDEVLKRLLAQKKVIQYDKERELLIHSGFFDQARDEIISTLDKYHRDFPLKSGLSKEELRSRTAGSSNPKLFQYLINRLIHQDMIAQERDLLRLKDHKVTLKADQEKMRLEIEEIYRKSGLQPPYFRELKEELSGNGGEDVLQVMVKDGLLIKVKEDLYFHRQAIEDLKERLVSFLKTNGEISTPEFKDMTGTSRKYTIPLLEYLDRSQFTVRVGDSRVLRKRE